MATLVDALAGARTLQAFRSRDFRLVWAGQTVSLIGNAAFLVAVGWKTLEITGSAGSLGIVLAAEGLAMLATLLIGGALADRYERRRLMIVSDLARLGVVAALAVTDATGNLTFPLLIAFAVGVGLGDGFFHPAFGGIVPLVVEKPYLASANAMIGISQAAELHDRAGARGRAVRADRLGDGVRVRRGDLRRLAGAALAGTTRARSRPSRARARSRRSSPARATSRAFPGCG